jgi:hypothetical protein
LGIIGFLATGVAGLGGLRFLDSLDKKVGGYILKIQRHNCGLNPIILKSVERTLRGGVGSREFGNIGIFWGGGDD